MNMQARFAKQWNPAVKVDLTAKIADDVKKVANMSVQEIIDAGKQAVEYLEKEAGNIVDVEPELDL